jgi:hypothetical protein
VIPGLRRRHFHFLARLTRFIIPHYRYEAASLWRRLLSDFVQWIDRVTLSIPRLEELGGIGVMHGRTGRS